MPSNKIYLLTFIFLSSLVTTVSAQTPSPEAGCRYCHESINPAVTISATHHDKMDTIIPNPTDAPYGIPGTKFECVSCHAIKSSCGSVTYIIETDCTACHDAADNHHTPTPSTCTSCHEIDRPAEPHPQIRDCAECHLDAGNSWLGATYDHTPAPSTCVSCHEDDLPADPHPQLSSCFLCHRDVGKSWIRY
jgi:hypothetical protein